MIKEGYKIKWSPRVSREKLRRLYVNDATGMLDNALIDDVGITLYLRCRDILTVHRNKIDKVITCPWCLQKGQESLIPRSGGLDEHLMCDVCGLEMTYRDWRKSLSRRQMNPGGAVSVFREYMQNFDAAKDHRHRMLAIDRLIHEFHYYLRNGEMTACRPVCVNLIKGKLHDLVPFLDELGQMVVNSPKHTTYETWAAAVAARDQRNQAREAQRQSQMSTS
jgi:hypothetical protein